MKQFKAVILWAVVAFSLTDSVHAQYTANFQTNTISGVTSNWVGDYIVGNTTYKNVLRVISHGVLSDNNGFLSHYSSNSSNNVATVSGTGSVWTNSGSLYVGSSGTGNALTITNGGAVFNYYGLIGNSFTNNNSVTVTGAGSVWNNFSWLEVGYEGSNNTLTIANGGAVLDSYGYVGYLYFGSNNLATVTGTSSVWSNSADLVIGAPGPANTLIITNGGAAFSVNGYVGQTYTAYGNAGTIAGASSVWRNSGDLYVGSSASSNVLTIAGGSVLASNVYISGSFRLPGYGIPSNNVIRVNSGSLFVTNAMGNGALVVSQIGGPGSLIVNDGSVTADELIATNGANSIISFNGGTLTAGSALVDNGQDFVIGSTSSNATYITGGGTHVFNNNFVVRRGALLLNSGTVTVNQLVLTNGANSTITFDGGALNSAGTFVTNNQQFVVGNGASGANFHLLGGVHSFNDGLRIRNAASLTGCGTVNGTVAVDAGGSVYTDCGALTFTGIVTNNGAMAADDGSILESSGTLVNNGYILLFNGGSINFSGTFINNGIILNAGWTHISDQSLVGNDVVITIPSVVGFTYQLQISPSVELPTWIATGAPQSGTGSVLTFTDPGSATNRPNYFYRIDVSAP